MPKTKFQKVVFGLIMSYSMAYPMEVYNVAIKMGFNLSNGLGFSSMTNQVFLEALKEVWYMGLIVFAFSSLWGNKMGKNFANKYCTENDNPYFYRIMRQAGTVAVMCPSMSLAASVIFNVILGGSPVFSSLQYGRVRLLRIFLWRFFGICLAQWDLLDLYTDLFSKIKKTNKKCVLYYRTRFLFIVYNFFYCIKAFGTDNVLDFAGVVHRSFFVNS